MKDYLYSEGSFYPYNEIEIYESVGKWPQSGVDVDKETRERFIVHPQGMILGQDSDGMPLWVNAPPRSQEQIVSENEVKKSSLRTSSDSEISWRQDAVDAEIATDEEVADLAAWKKYRVLLMRVDTSNPQWPDMPE